MSGTVVNCTNLDSVRIEVLGGGRAVTIPAALILAVDAALRCCAVEGVSLEVDLVSDDATGREGFQATLDMGQFAVGGMAASPWAAVVSLAEAL